MTPEVSALWSAIIAAASGLLGTTAGAIATYFAMRQQTRVAIEAVKTQVEIARAERRSAFALAALEKRLEIHQEAYRHWTDLYWNWHKDAARDIAHRCQEFWYANCMYLDPASRDSFKRILFHAGTFHSYDDAMKQQVFDQLTDVGRHLTEGVDLHFMRDRLETARIEDVGSTASDITADGPTKCR